MPLWWKACSIIGLDADIQHPVYRRFLLNKIYTWCPESGFGTVMMDKPMVENKYKNAIKYQNQWQFGPFPSADSWLDWIYKKDLRLNFRINDPKAKLDDLLKWSSLFELITGISEQLKSNFDRDDLYFVWNHWMDSNQHLL